MTIQPDAGLLGLVLIVRDEADRVRAALDAYRPIVDDVTILDTGSADGTQDVVRAAIAGGLRGQLHEAPFVDFSSARNRALDLHGERTTFTLMVNVDLLQGDGDGEALRGFLADRVGDAYGAYRVRIMPGCYYQTLVLRSAARWRYVGRTHEVAVAPPGAAAEPGPIVPGVAVVFDRSRRSPDAWRRRWLRDVDLLQADLTDRPGDPRATFYLAQTWECLGDLPRARDLYQARAGMAGYVDETYEATFRLARVLDHLEADPVEVDAAYLRAHSADPRRAEPLCAVALRRFLAGDHALAYLLARRAAELPQPATDMFVDEEVYAWRALDLVASSALRIAGADPPALWVGLEAARRACEARPGDARLAKNLKIYRTAAMVAGRADLAV